MEDFRADSYDFLLLWKHLEDIAFFTNDPTDWKRAECAKQIYALRQPLGRNDSDWLDDD